MYPIVSFVCAAGAGLWAGGLLNGMSRRYATPGSGETISAVPMRILSAIAFGLAVLSVNFSAEWLIALPFAGALVVVSICDIRHMVIPDAITLPGIAAAAALRLFIHPLPYWDYVAAALIGSGLFYIAALLFRGIGGGDIKLLALTGLVLGIQLTVLSFLLFCMAGMVAGVLIIVTGRFRQDMIVPFGPFIALAAIASYYWGSDAISWAVNRLIL